MQFCRNFLIIFLCLLLQACCATSPHMCQELEWGKLKFQNGNYKRAFCILLPVAANGNPEAEYAVGYMYYYGYGVPRDCDSGLFWMTRSANQHYCPAIRALELINHGPPPCIPCPPVYPCDQPGIIHEIHPCFHRPMMPVERDEVGRPCGSPGNLCGVPHRAHVTVYPPPVVRHPIVVRPLDVRPLSQASDSQRIYASLQKQLITSKTSPSYSLQLFGAYQLADVKKEQAKLHLQKSTYIYHTQNKGRDWYILTFGKYTSVSDAKSVIHKLPMQAQELGPWVRKLV